MALTASDWSTGLALAAPWIVTLLAIAWRWRGSPSLDDVGDAPSDGPLSVSVIVPARNEARHIVGCVGSILASDYESLAVIVVDDRSSDGTGELARAIADHRLTVIDGDEPPEGWFGKQWACAAGARVASGDVLLFTDADTRHGTDLVRRAVASMIHERLDFLSVLGQQSLETFWERVVQPQMFLLLLARFGGPGAVNRSTRAADKLANGQCLFFRRPMYESIGGHAAVRHRVAEDFALSQRVFLTGGRSRLVLGLSQLSTRMYTSLGEIVHGWAKNIFVAGREALPFRRFRGLVTALVLPLPPLLVMAPVIAATAAAVGAIGAWGVPFAIASGMAVLACSGAIVRRFRLPVVYALAAPLGALVVLGIALYAIARGSRVEWKGRRYVVDDR
jgi:chlorobactene glucosyltransferase